ncbi:hypothetical protein D3C79_850020 [compost metagenome]
MQMPDALREAFGQLRGKLGNKRPAQEQRARRIVVLRYGPAYPLFPNRVLDQVPAVVTHASIQQRAGRCSPLGQAVFQLDSSASRKLRDYAGGFLSADWQLGQ